MLPCNACALFGTLLSCFSVCLHLACACSHVHKPMCEIFLCAQAWEGEWIASPTTHYNRIWDVASAATFSHPARTPTVKSTGLLLPDARRKYRPARQSKTNQAEACCCCYHSCLKMKPASASQSSPSYLPSGLLWLLAICALQDVHMFHPHQHLRACLVPQLHMV